jgi:heme exporter protein C
MKNIILLTLAAAAGLLLVRDFYVILLQLPDELNQGSIWRILMVHVPGAFVAAMCAMVSLVASILYLAKKDLFYDALSVAVVEVGLAFGAINLITGMIWGRIIWGIWWAWDARLTSMLICWLMYSGYLMLRGAVEEPTMRARNSAVLSIFISPGLYITWKSIEWWRTQHPGPVFQARGGGGFAPEMLQILMLNMLALILFATVLTIIRLRQVETQRELEGLRREAHAI